MNLKSKKMVPLWLLILSAPVALPQPFGTSLFKFADDSKAGHQILERTSEAFNEVARKATPAVVSIDSVKTVKGRDAIVIDPLNPDPDPLGSGEGRQAVGVGSGVIIRSNGLVLTSAHVVERAQRIRVTLSDKSEHKAHVVGTDPKTDTALLQIEKVTQALPTVTFANSDNVQVGDWAIAIGSPFGLNQTVTSGIISAKGRGQMGMLDIEDFFQTDTPINPGNSGGPLLNIHGELIGLNAAIFSQSGGFLGIGFAVPSNLVHQVADDIIQHGRVIRGWIGVSAQDLDNDLARYFRTSSTKGALISEVRGASPAAQGDLEIGDVVLSFDGKAIGGSTELKSAVARTQIGKQVSIQVLRGGSAHVLSVQVREQPSSRREAQLAAHAPTTIEKPKLGLDVQDIPPEVSELLNVPSGTGAFVMGVQPGGIGYDSGLTPGDIILKANGQDIHGANEFDKIAKRHLPRQTVVLYVQRGPNEKVFLPLKSPLA